MGSLWGHVTTCSACDFLFQSNHSYDTSGFIPEMRGFFGAVCFECLQPYIFPTESAWGPGEAELLELCTCVQEVQTKQQAKKKVPRIWNWKGTGQYVLFEAELRDGRYLSDLICIKCTAVESIVIEFENGQPCPACKLGTLHCDQSV